MNTAILAVILAANPPISLSNAGVTHRLVVTPEGAEVVLDNGTGSLISLGQMTGRIASTTPRWTVPDAGQFWICNDVAIGDHGSSVFASKSLNNEALTMYPAGIGSPVFNFSALGSEEPVVSIADRAARAAAMVIFDTNPDPNIFDFVATVHAFKTFGSNVPDWSYTFPPTSNYFGGGVAVSDNGNVVLTWKANPNTQTLLVEAFTGNGAPISSAQLFTTYAGNRQFHSRQTRLSDDGARAYFNIGTKAVIYDVASAVVLFEYDINASFDSHAFSGDGKRFAFGYFGYFRVISETSPGVWTQIAQHNFGGSTYVAYLDMNTDGSRVGYQIQRYSPAYDHIEIGLYNVAANTDFFNHSYDAPGTAYQLVCSGCEVDDNADYVAGCSWGDSLNATPEGFVFDDAGTATCELDARGSAFGIGFDADGDVFGIGTKAVHANTFGNGGDVIVADAYTQELHIIGFPQLGAAVQLTAPGPAGTIRVAVCDSLGNSNTPYGQSELNLGTLLQSLGPINIPSIGLSLNLNIPNIAALAGNDVHLQGAITRGGQSHLTNKVSVRLIP